MADLEQELQNARWHGEPPKWAWVDGALTVTTGHDTDFWQGTFYGFYRDDGHFLGRPVTGDFTAVLTFDADYQMLYDQAGLMVRRDSRNWVKAGIEYSDGMKNFSVVITRDGRSDWSVIGVPGLSGAQRIRLTRLDDSIIVHHLDERGGWRLMRLGELPLEREAHVGPMTCSPQRSGLEVRFLDLEIGQPAEDPLHAV